jgi:hypothetical protein
MEGAVLKRLQVVATLFVVAGLAALPALAGPSAPVGIVTAAQHAVIGQVTAVDGTSIYDGDTLTTDATGALRLRFGASQMILGGNSEVILHKTDAGVSATLVRGDIRFASMPGSPLEVRTLKSVIVRAKGDKPATGQLNLIGPNTFQVGSTKGDFDVSVNGVDHEVNESNAYRVNVDDAGAPTGGSGNNNNSTPGAGTSGGVWIAIAIIAGGTATAIILAFLSPSKP